MSHHLSTERMHDLIDGLLPSEDAREARDHLRGCLPCREAHDRLADTVAALGDLPGEARVPEGLWSAIEGRIAPASSEGPTEVGETDVLPFPGGATRSGRRFAFTLSQLAAAAAVVAVLSAGTVWMAMSGRGPDQQAAVPSATQDAGLGPAARLAASGDVAYDEALLELQGIVEQGRNVLAPETVQALDRSLETIDQAISDIREALAKDPSSQLLARMLINQQRTKLRVLRQAATAMQPRS